MSDEKQVTVIKDDYSLTKLFLTKKVKVYVDKDFFTIFLPPIKYYLEDSEWNAAYHLFTMDLAEWKKMIPNQDLKESYDFLTLLLFGLSRYVQYRELGNVIQRGLEILNEDVDINWTTKTISINNFTMTSEIWNYIVYLLKLSCGNKVTQPLHFNNPQVREFFEKQQELEKKIQEAKNKGKGSNNDDLLKAFLMITYYFPSLTFDYLFNQTMAQIRWLQEKAAGATSYEFNAKAFAAGNVKKGKKLDFFIK